MKLRSRVLPLALAGALALSACATPDEDSDVSAGDGATEATESEATETETDIEEASEPEATETDASETEADEAAGSVEIAVESGDLGDHLVDGDGNAFYVSTEDEQGVSNCGLECARLWQPVEGEVTVSGDLDESLLATAEREDGIVQVTYDGAPLYRFVADQPGETRGHGVNGTWFAVDTEGQPILEGGVQGQSDEPAEDDAEDA